MNLNNANSERISSGIVELDRILAGGFPEGVFCSVQGDIGSGTTTFCTQVVWSRLVSGGLAAYLCFDETPERIIEHFQSFGHDIQPYIQRNHFLIHDGHPFLNSLAAASQGQNGVSQRRILLNKFLEEYTKKTCDARKQNASILFPVVSVIDSFSSIAPYIDLKSVYVLAHMIANLTRKHGNLMLAVSHAGSMEANVLCACNSSADCIIRLETNLARGVLKRVLRIDKMAFTSTPEYEMEYVITAAQGMQIVNSINAGDRRNHRVGQLSV